MEVIGVTRVAVSLSLYAVFDLMTNASVNQGRVKSISAKKMQEYASKNESAKEINSHFLGNDNLSSLGEKMAVWLLISRNIVYFTINLPCQACYRGRIYGAFGTL